MIWIIFIPLLVYATMLTINIGFLGCISGLHTIVYASYYLFKDFYHYVKNREWKKFRKSGIIGFGGLFGTGKTFNAVQYVVNAYRHHDNVQIYSNVDLVGIPYTKFEYFEQLREDVPVGITRIYLCDEFGSLFNSRNYQSNKITEVDYIATLNQLRKEGKLLVVVAQRYGMLDKMFRQVMDTWYECRKCFRVMSITPYDPYELEYTLDPRIVKPLGFPRVCFATDKRRSYYNTNQVVKNFSNVIEITNRSDSSTPKSDYKYSSGAKRSIIKRSNRKLI